MFAPLSACQPVAFIPTLDAERARAFYLNTLGLRLVEDQLPFALVFDLNGTPLRVTKVPALTPHPFTVLGWQVAGINAVARQLAAKGVVFLRYDQMDQDEDGVWTVPGAKVAWFHDPDGNTLSISEH